MKFLLIVLNIVCCNATLLAAEKLTYSEKFESLTKGIPILEDTPNRGMTIKGDLGFVTVAQLAAWADRLKPKTHEEFAIAQKYFSHKVGEIRWIAIYSTAKACGMNFFDLPDDITFNAACLPTESADFKRLGAHMNERIRKYIKNAGQDGAGQAPTAPESK